MAIAGGSFNLPSGAYPQSQQGMPPKKESVLGATITNLEEKLEQLAAQQPDKYHIINKFCEHLEKSYPILKKDTWTRHLVSYIGNIDNHNLEIALIEEDNEIKVVFDKIKKIK